MEEKKKSQRLDIVPIHRDELIELLKAKIERNLILAVAVQNNFSSFKIDELLEALAKLNGLISEEEKPDA